MRLDWIAESDFELAKVETIIILIPLWLPATLLPKKQGVIIYLEQTFVIHYLE